MERVALCICTHARPAGLRKALEHVAKLRFAGALRVIVVDNHPAQAGMEVCASVRGYPHSLVWLHEPEPGISAARNAAVRAALTEPVDFIAMIDDDGWPEPHWLNALLACQAQRDAAIVCGPIEPAFEMPPPFWAAGGEHFRYGTNPKTSNVLFRARLFHERDYPWFDPGFNRSGGEDTHFVRQARHAGAVFAGCSGARVHETVPRERLTLRYVAARAFRNGSVNVRSERLLRPGIVTRLAHFGAALAKIGYGLDHLVFSLARRARIASAVDDFGEGFGMLWGQSGRPYGFYRGKPAPKRAPAVRTQPAKLTVKCHDDWASFADALCHLTPLGRGIWKDVAFVRGDAPRADWIGIFNQPGAKPVTIEASPNRVFFAVGEPPIDRYRNLHLRQVPGAFVLTSDDSPATGASASRRVVTPCMTRTWSTRRSIEELRQPATLDKPRRLSWVTSDLDSTPGYRYRLSFLKRLRGSMDFDLFGRGFKPVGDKWPTLAPYRYSIAFESARADYYFTEKLMDCFVAETFPLYYGSPAIGRFFPPESMHILDPEDPDVLEKTREVVHSDLWRARRDAVLEAKRLVLEEYNIFARLAKFVVENSAVAQPVQRLTIR